MSRDYYLVELDENGATVRGGDVYSYDNIRTQGYLEGHAPGVRAAANYLRGKAIELFSARKHEEAIEMQKLADALEKDLCPVYEARASEHEKEHPQIIKAAE